MGLVREHLKNPRALKSGLRHSVRRTERQGMSDEEDMDNVMLHSHSGEKPRQAGRILGVSQVEQELELCEEGK